MTDSRNPHVPTTALSGLDEDGYSVTADGTVVGRHDPEPFDALPEFDAPAVDSAMRYRLKLEADVLAARKALLVATAHLEGCVRRAEARLTFWDRTYYARVCDFAVRHMRGDRKTYDSLYGTVSSRTVKGVWKVKDKADALAFVKKWTPELVRVKVKEWVNPGACVEALKEAGCDLDEEPTWLEYRPSHEKMVVSAGVLATKGVKPKRRTL